MKAKFGIIVLLLCLLLTQAGCKVWADEAFLGVSPPIIYIRAQAPSIIETSINVRNLSPKKQTFRIELKPFTAAVSQDGKIEYVNAKNTDLLFYKAIEFYDSQDKIKSIILDGYQSKRINVKIPVEQGAPSQDYYFSLAFIQIPINTLDTNGVSFETGISTNVLLAVGNGNSNLSINSFSAPFYVGNNQAPFALLIENTGNQMTQARGKIEIHDMFGNLIDTLSLTPTYLLSHSSRYISGERTQTLSKSHPETLWNASFMFGIYNAKATIQDSKGAITVKSLHFIAFPTYALLLFIVIVIFISGVYLRIRKKVKALRK